jgi:hypothetical protein
MADRGAERALPIRLRHKTTLCLHRNRHTAPDRDRNRRYREPDGKPLDATASNGDIIERELHLKAPCPGNLREIVHVGAEALRRRWRPDHYCCFLRHLKARGVEIDHRAPICGLHSLGNLRVSETHRDGAGAGMHMARAADGSARRCATGVTARNAGMTTRDTAAWACVAGMSATDTTPTGTSEGVDCHVTTSKRDRDSQDDCSVQSNIPHESASFALLISSIMSMYGNW